MIPLNQTGPFESPFDLDLWEGTTSNDPFAVIQRQREKIQNQEEIIENGRELLKKAHENTAHAQAITAQAHQTTRQVQQALDTVIALNEKLKIENAALQARVQELELQLRK